MFRLFETKDVKCLRSENYNWDFNKKDGFFKRWGKTIEDDPAYGLPEIADIELSTICSGIKGKPCPFCYKSNTPNGINMSFDTYKSLIDKLFFIRNIKITLSNNKVAVFGENNFVESKKQAKDVVVGDIIEINNEKLEVKNIDIIKATSITQIAFGIGDLDSNPDLKKIITYTREVGIIPNITINGDKLTKDWVKFFANNLGAIAVSLYDKKLTYDAVDKLTKAGMTQVNIHCMASIESEERIYEAFRDIKKDKRLKNLNAIVLLSLKNKGRGRNFNIIPQEKFQKIVETALNNKINIGFDSCSAFKVINSLNKEDDSFKTICSMVEPCESTCFSSYFNAEGKFFPCSFIEGTIGWELGIDVINSTDFLKDVWFSEKTRKTREKIIETRKNSGNCYYFEV